MSTCPIVACVGTFTEVFSKWLDYQMKRLLPLSSSYIKDSNELLLRLKPLEKLPSNARLFTSDAKAMYTNIDITTGIDSFEKIFTHFSDFIPKDFPYTMFILVLNIVMSNNIFQFGDTYWLQLVGAAMGTSCACLYATLVYAVHEQMVLLTTFKDNLLIYVRFIDDIFGIWIDTDVHNFDTFKSSLPYGNLTWKTTPLDTWCDFLDVTITIESSRFLSIKTFQKMMNLYLYLPRDSAHPPGALKGLIVGNLLRYWKQNTYIEDYIYITTLFLHRLIARGCTLEELHPLFVTALEHIIYKERSLAAPKPSILPVSPTDQRGSDTLSFHTEYHPRDLSRRIIRNLYKKHLEEYCGFERLIVCYSRPSNLRDKLIHTALPDNDGSQASHILQDLT